MAIFNFRGIRIAAMATTMPTYEVRPDDFKEQFGEEEVEKFRSGLDKKDKNDKKKNNNDLSDNISFKEVITGFIMRTKS